MISIVVSARSTAVSEIVYGLRRLFIHGITSDLLGYASFPAHSWVFSKGFHSRCVFSCVFRVPLLRWHQFRVFQLNHRISVLCGHKCGGGFRELLIDSVSTFDICSRPGVVEATLIFCGGALWLSLHVIGASLVWWWQCIQTVFGSVCYDIEVCTARLCDPRPRQGPLKPILLLFVGLHWQWRLQVEGVHRKLST